MDLRGALFVALLSQLLSVWGANVLRGQSSVSESENAHMSKTDVAIAEYNKLLTPKGKVHKVWKTKTAPKAHKVQKAGQKAHKAHKAPKKASLLLQSKSKSPADRELERINLEDALQ